jgi:hypothetical protein
MSDNTDQATGQARTMRYAAVSLFMRHPVLIGGLLGLTWGAVLRVWMRFIASDPEFSLSGTGFILGACTIAGVAIGIASMRRVRGGRGWWRLWGLTTLALGGGAGSIMVPSFLLGAAAFGRTTWKTWVRISLAAMGVAIQVVVFAASDIEMGLTKTIVAFVWYSVMITFEAWAISVFFRPSLHTGPRRDRSTVSTVVPG